MKVNFLIKVNRKEDFIHAAQSVRVLSSFSKIKSNCLIYSDSSLFGSCDVECLKDKVLYINCVSDFNLFQDACSYLASLPLSEDCNIWVKLDAHTWICDENYLITLLSIINSDNIDIIASISSGGGIKDDILIMKGSLNEGFVESLFKSKNDSMDIGSVVIDTLSNNNYNLYLNPFRNLENPENNIICRKIGWTMNTDFNKNIEALDFFLKRRQRTEEYTNEFLSFFRKGESDLVLNI